MLIFFGFWTAMLWTVISGSAIHWQVLVSNSFAFIAMFRLEIILILPAKVWLGSNRFVMSV